MANGPLKQKKIATIRQWKQCEGWIIEKINIENKQTFLTPPLTQVCSMKGLENNSCEMNPRKKRAQRFVHVFFCTSSTVGRRNMSLCSSSTRRPFPVRTVRIISQWPNQHDVWSFFRMWGLLALRILKSENEWFPVAMDSHVCLSRFHGWIANCQLQHVTLLAPNSRLDYE